MQKTIASPSVLCQTPTSPSYQAIKPRTDATPRVDAQSTCENVTSVSSNAEAQSVSTQTTGQEQGLAAAKRVARPPKSPRQTRGRPKHNKNASEPDSLLRETEELRRWAEVKIGPRLVAFAPKLENETGEQLPGPVSGFEETEKIISAPAADATPISTTQHTDDSTMDLSGQFMCIHGALRSAKRHLQSNANAPSRMRLALVYFARAAALLDNLTEGDVGRAICGWNELCDVLLRTTKLMMVTRCRLEAERRRTPHL